MTKQSSTTCNCTVINIIQPISLAAHEVHKLTLIIVVAVSSNYISAAK